MLNTKKKKMKEEILSQINDMLDIMPDKKLATIKIKKVKLEKKAKKMALIKLFYELQSLIAEQNVTQVCLRIQRNMVNRIL